MKFQFIITNLAGGGAERVLITLAFGLSERGHDVELILFEDRIDYCLPSTLNTTTLTKKAPSGWLGKRYLAHKLRSHLKSTPPADLIVSALPFANEVSVLSNLKNHWCRVDSILGMEINNLAAKNSSKAKRRLSRYRRLLNSRDRKSVVVGKSVYNGGGRLI